MQTERTALQIACDAGLRLLARREHSRRELRLKLRQRGFESELVEAALDRLAAQDYLSDTRFAQLYARERLARGYGALRIEAELQQRGVAGETIAEALAELSGQWRPALQALYRRKFGERAPGDRREWQKRARFLESRGFAAAAIRGLLGDYG